MPELPEVQALVDSLGERTSGATIVGAELAALSALKTFDPPLSALVGASVVEVERRGKHIVMNTADVEGENLALVIHLARAGWMSWKDGVAARAKPGRGPLALRVTFDRDGATGVMDVTEAGTKKSLAIYVVRDVDAIDRVARLGRDPVRQPMTPAELNSILQGQGKRRLKTVLRDQSVLAGVGNAYSDEILHAAHLSPFTPAGTLTDAQLQGLYSALTSVLADAIERAHGVAWNELKDGKRTSMAVHARTGQPCPVCGDIVREVSYVDESFQYCPKCQTGGQVLADRRMSRLLK
jgi:formamidopyrimidine-DNA glycosylase